MQDAVIVSAVRTAVGKAPKGTLSVVRPDDMASVVIREALERAPGAQAVDVDDVILGCAMPEGEQGMNVARIASLRAGVPIDASAVTINRFCSSGLQAIAYGAERIMVGHANLVVAGGTESMSMVPMGGNKVSANPEIMEKIPEVYTSMGATAENIASRYSVSREDADKFAAESQRRAATARETGKFREEIAPITVKVFDEDGKQHTVTVKDDTILRPETTVEGLAKLRPAFNQKGVVTAGNASPLTDGAAAAVLMSEDKAKELGLEPKARIVSAATRGNEPEYMGVAPIGAIKKVFERTGMSMSDIDVVELNEAFAAQVIPIMDECNIPLEKMNPHGGAIALGHPFGMTGARIMTTLLNDLETDDKTIGLETMCVGGGQGMAMVVERLR